MFDFLNEAETIKIIVSIGAMVVFGIGLFALLTRKSFLKLFMAIALMETSIFIYFIGMTFRVDAFAPITDAAHKSIEHMNDPIPHAMILTAIVIGMAILALGVSFAIEYYKVSGNNSIDQMKKMKG